MTECYDGHEQRKRIREAIWLNNHHDTSTFEAQGVNGGPGDFFPRNPVTADEPGMVNGDVTPADNFFPQNPVTTDDAQPGGHGATSTLDFFPRNPVTETGGR